MTKALYTLNSRLSSWLFALVFTSLCAVQTSAQCVMVCNDLVNVSLDDDCAQTILPDMILEGNGCPNGNFSVQMRINGQWVPANVNSSHIGMTIPVRVRDLNTNNSCTGNIFVEDKWKPQLSCTDLTLNCAITNYTPAYLANTLNIAGANPSVTENCGTFTTSYLDTWNDLPCNGSINGRNNVSAYIRRVWTATDDSGNTGTCVQFIYLERRTLAAVQFPANKDVPCDNPNTTPANTGVPSIAGFGQQFPLFPDQGSCEFNVFYEDTQIPICRGMWKILRTWSVLDWCQPTQQGVNPRTFIQIIKVVDDDGPSIACPGPETVSTNPNDCERDLNLPDVIISDNCSRVASISATWEHVNGSGSLNGTLSNFPGNNPWNPDTLGVLGVANNLPIGQTVVTYTAADDCGNLASCTFEITVEDGTPPTVACDQTTVVALSASGMAFVDAITFDDKSYDNCAQQLFFKVRRMNANNCQDHQQFHDQAKFCCEDVGKTIQVVLRVYDITVPTGSVDLDFGENNSNDCMVFVQVQDKVKPNCVAPANVTVSCKSFDPSLWAYGQGTASDDCCLDTVITSVNYSQFDTLCNRGTITRSFRAVDCGGLSSTCTQRILVNYNQDYFVRFPDDRIVTTCDGTGNYGEPTFFGKDCEYLAVSSTDEIFTVVPDACFKIERTWKIINWCTYNANQPFVTVPNPNPNATVNAPANNPGPIISAPGTASPWAPTVVAVTPGAAPTNYSLFYAGGTYQGNTIPPIATSNGFLYKQLIKVLDGQDPTFDKCPTSPVDFCDLSANNPELWNEMYWWDNTISSHDLCEGPADLNVTGTDACSGANVTIRYLLFLDLDGNGTMETLVNSNETGLNGLGWNNIKFGSADGSPGTNRAFDERPVPANQKYGFALQITKNGNKVTGAVRWNTQQSPNTFLVPELPYGTHKIKWIMEDGCGNESVCEYTFVVKDCKVPTVVCHNGLSANIMPTGMITIWASDFLKYAEDNCTPANQLKYAIQKKGGPQVFPVDAQGNPILSVTFNCKELGSQEVELWALDKAGNAGYCTTYLIVQDPFGNCPSNGPNASVAGAIKTEDGEGVEEVSVELSVNKLTSLRVTDETGIFYFNNAVPMPGEFTLSPEKDANPLNGVSTYDLVLISKHILGLEPLTSPYKMIAADANLSNSITTLDIVELRKLILGIYTELPNSPSWRFVDKAQVFANPTNPFEGPIQESAVKTVSSGNSLGNDFVGIKVGDMNSSVIANSLMNTEDRALPKVFFDLVDRNFKQNDIIEVEFKSSEQMESFQFTLAYNNLELIDLIPGDHMGTDNFGVFTDAFTVSADKRAESFKAKFKALKDGSLYNNLAMTSRITRMEAYNSKGIRYEVGLRFTNESAAFELLQNRPNPVGQSTDIIFFLPESSEATLTITDAKGRLIKRIEGAFYKGYNRIPLTRGDLRPGLLFYQLDTPTHSATRKMFVAE